MNTIGIKENLFCKSLICLLLGHKIITTRTITSHIKEYKCTNCNLELTNDVMGKTAILTPERKEINEALKDFLLKKDSLKLSLVISS
jgi:hypothetical protein